MTYPMRPILPQELIDLIIDFHCDDVAALRDLALVSHACLYSARHHLFSTVRVSSAPIGSSNLNLFQSRLLEGKTSVGALVRELDFASSRKLLFPISLDILVAALQCFPKLRSLTMTAVSIADSAKKCIPFGPRMALEKLSFTACRVRGSSWRPILEIMGLFSTVRDLSLIGTRTQSSRGTTGRFMLDYKVQVQSLTLLDIVEHTEDLFESIRDVVDLAGVDCLAVGFGLHIRRSYSHIVNSAATRLKRLTIHVNRDQDWPYRSSAKTNGHSSSLDLSTCTALNSIHLVLLGLSGSFTPTAFDIFQSLPPIPLISEVIIQLVYPYHKDLAGIHEPNASFMKAALCPEWRTLGRDLYGIPTLRSVIIILTQSISSTWTIPQSFRHVIDEALELRSSVNLQYVLDTKIE